jgi:hypothetical protein
MIAALLAAVPNAWSYVAAAYLICFGSILGYAAWMVVRGRKIGRQLPPEERRWSR